MDWYTIGVGAVCGAVAAVLAMLVARLFSSARTRQWVTAAVGALVFAALFGWARSTLIADHDLATSMDEFESEIAGNPAFEAIREFAPDTMTEIRDYVRTAHAQGHDAARVEQEVRQLVSAVTQRSLPKSSDEALLGSVRLAMDQMRVLAGRGDDSCFRYLFPQVDGGIQVQEVFTPEMMDRDYATTALVVSSYDAARPVPTQADAMQVLQPIYIRLFDKYGQAAVAGLGDVTAPGTDRRQLCDITIDLYADILAEPENDAALALRWMMSDEIPGQ